MSTIRNLTSVGILTFAVIVAMWAIPVRADFTFMGFTAPSFNAIEGSPTSLTVMRCVELDDVSDDGYGTNRWAFADFRVTWGTALESQGYEAATGTVALAPGVMWETFQIPVPRRRHCFGKPWQFVCVLDNFRGVSASYFRSTEVLVADADTVLTRLPATGVRPGDRFGHAVSVSGNRVLVGAPGDDERGDNAGGAYVFEWRGDSWIQSAKLTAPDCRTNDYFGSSLALQGDWALVGAPRYKPQGCTYLFRWDGSGWSVQSNRVATSPPNAPWLQGEIIVGMNENYATIGSVVNPQNFRVFRRGLDRWSAIDTVPCLPPSFPPGSSVLACLEGHRVVSLYSGYYFQLISAYYGYYWKYERGIVGARIREYDGRSSWVDRAVPFGDPITANQGTIRCVAASERFCFAGTTRTNGGGSVETLAIPSAFESTGRSLGVIVGSAAGFGSTCAGLDSYLLVGAPGDEFIDSFSGSVHIYHMADDQWTPVGDVTPPVATAGMRFGSAIAISDNWVAIGAEGDTTHMTGGDAYVMSMAIPMRLEVLAEAAVEGTPILITVSVDAEDHSLPISVLLEDGQRVMVSTSLCVMAGATSVTCRLTADDAMLNGTRVGRIQVVSAGYLSAEQPILIRDNDTTQLHLDMPERLDEGAGEVDCTVAAARAPQTNFVVTLSNNSQRRFSVSPPNIILPAGETQTTFRIGFPRDSEWTEDGIVRFAAHVDGWSDGIADVRVVEATESLLMSAPTNVREDQGSFDVVVGLSAWPYTNLLLHVESSDTSELETPQTIEVVAGSLSARFPVRVIHDALLDGLQHATIGVSCGDWFGASSVVCVADMDGGCFGFETGLVTVCDNQAVTLRVERTFGSLGSAEVDYWTCPGTATEGRDYRSVTGTLAFSEGETEKTILVPLVKRIRQVESERSFRVVLASDSLISQGTATVVLAANTQETCLMATDGTTGSLFGCAVSLCGSALLVGAMGDGERGAGAGAAYVFEHDFLGWKQTAKLLGDTDARAFGFSAALKSDYAVIGAPGGGEGAAYVFKRASTNWALCATLTGGGPLFGYAVALTENYAAISSTERRGKGNVTLFHRTRDGWIQHAELAAPQGVAGDSFGEALAFSGDWLMVGADGTDSRGSWNSGSVYLFRESGTNWEYISRSGPPNGSQGDMYGFVLGLSDEHAIVGAPGSSHYSNGGCYFFERFGAFLQRESVTGETSPSWSLERNGGIHSGYSVALHGANALCAEYAYSNEYATPRVVLARRRSSSDWAPVGQWASGKQKDAFGVACGLSGRFAAIGACTDNEKGDFAGKVYVEDISPPIGLEGLDSQYSQGTEGEAVVVKLASESGDPVALEIISSDPSILVTHPSNVVIETGALCVTCRLDLTAPSLLDGWREVALTVRSPNYPDRAERIRVCSTNRVFVSLEVPREVEEGGLVICTVRIDRVAQGDVKVRLGADNPFLAEIPEFATIASGSVWTVFSATLADNNGVVDDSPRCVCLAAELPGSGVATGSVVILDNEPRIITLDLADVFVEGQSWWRCNGRVCLSAPCAKTMVIHLSSSDATGLSVPDVVTIPAGSTSVSFDFTAVDDPFVDGTQATVVSAWMDGWTTATKRVLVLDNEPGRLLFSASSYTCLAGETAIVAIVRTESTNGELKATYRSYSRNAAAWASYVPVQGEVVFRDGDERKTISLPTISAPEGTEKGCGLLLEWKTSDGRCETSTAQVAILSSIGGDLFSDEYGYGQAAAESCGQAVAIAKGVAAVGAPNAAGGGCVYLREFDGQAWMPAGELRPPRNDCSGFGTVLAMVSNLLVVTSLTGPATNQERCCFVYERRETNWFYTCDLRSDRTSISNRFGHAVAIGCGYIAVGSPGAETSGVSCGCVYIFREAGTNWVLERTWADPDTEEGAAFGISVAAWGACLLVGAPNADGGKGAVHVYRMDRDKGATASRLCATNGTERAFGWSVSVYDCFAVVGAPGEDSGRGAVYFFRNTNQEWLQIQTMTSAGRRIGLQNGRVVRIWGKYAAVAAQASATHVYRRVDAGWQYWQTVSPPWSTASSVHAIAGIGSSIIIGAGSPFDNPFARKKESISEWIVHLRYRVPDGAFICQLGIDTSPDVDSDGMSDFWENACFGDLRPDGTCDADGDGMRDFDEFIAGSDPTNRQDFLTVDRLDCLWDDDVEVVNWATHVGRKYVLQRCTNLAGMLWNDVCTTEGSGSALGFTNVPCTAQRAYYRLKVMMPDVTSPSGTVNESTSRVGGTVQAYDALPGTVNGAPSWMSGGIYGTSDIGTPSDLLYDTTATTSTGTEDAVTQP